MNKITIRVIGLLLCCISMNTFAIDIPQGILPGTLTPGRMGQPYAQPMPNTPKASRPITPPQAAGPTLGPEAAAITFPLKKIIFTGNTVYTDQQLLPIYQSKLNTRISVTDLEIIVQDITNFYRNNGYILSRAVLPPQSIQHGVVQIRIVEGFIDKVTLSGEPRLARKLLLAYADKIKSSRPLRLQVLEQYLYLANEIPGVQVQSVLEPSKILNTSVSDLNLIVKEQPLTGYVSYDNFQSRYTGPLEVTGNLNVNSFIRSGDSTRVTYIAATTMRELRFADISYETPIGENGMRARAGGNESLTAPGFILEPADLRGDSPIFYGNLTYPLLRSHTTNITLDGGFNYADSYVTVLHEPYYADHVRSLIAGGNSTFFDRFNGSDQIAMHIEKGFPFFGATTSTTTTTTSRFGANGNFAKLTGSFSRQQSIFQHLAIYGFVAGQYTPVPLLAYEQFGFGGAQIGRGYDPSELLGDKGLEGSFEVRSNFFPGWQLLQTLQGFIFYDIGVIWNVKDLPNTLSKQSASSTGIGVRFYFTKNLTGTWTIAQPLTKEETTLAFIGRGRAPRTLFNITLSSL